MIRFLLILACLAAWAVQAQNISSASSAPLVRGLPDFSDLVERHGASVINISTYSSSKGRAPLAAQEEDETVPEVFKRFFPRLSPSSGGREEPRTLGSGFILTSEGHILTNAHVVEQVADLVVRTSDRREFRARVLGVDRRTDLAVIKIDASGLPAVRVGSPALLRQGEWVVAMGSPFGFENSVTAGIVSAKGRSLPQENYVPFIQTDVVINPGSSGGPLFNQRGEVVGINSLMVSRSGGFTGISFAIPMDVAMEVFQQIRLSGRVVRGRIGVQIQEGARDGGREGGGVIYAVEPGGPADRAGMESGDVVLRFNGQVVTSSIDLPRLIASARPGARVPVQIQRKGTLREFMVHVIELAEDRAPSRSGTR